MHAHFCVHIFDLRALCGCQTYRSLLCIHNEWNTPNPLSRSADFSQMCDVNLAKSLYQNIIIFVHHCTCKCTCISIFYGFENIANVCKQRLNKQHYKDVRLIELHWPWISIRQNIKNRDFWKILISKPNSSYIHFIKHEYFIFVIGLFEQIHFKKNVFYLCFILHTNIFCKWITRHVLNPVLVWWKERIPKEHFNVCVCWLCFSTVTVIHTQKMTMDKSFC